METAITLGGLVFPAGKLICKIIRAAETATQNKAECADLAGRLSVMHKLLVRLRLQGPEAEEVLSGLGHTLDDAHELVVACHRWGAPRKLAFAGAHAERFAKLNRRIDSHLNLIQLCCHIDVTHPTSSSS